MIEILKRCRAPFIAVSLVLVLICLCGCEDRKTVAPSAPGRTQDEAYLKKLDDGRKALKTPAKVSNRVKSEMMKVIETARANLPKGATDEQIRAELEGHPDRYPQWKELVAQNAAANASIEKKLEENRNMVRQRILKEAAEQKKAPAAKN